MNTDVIQLINYNHFSDNGSFSSSYSMSKGVWEENIKKRISSIPVETLNNNLSQFVNAISRGLSDVTSEINGFQLEEVELKLEIGANGEIGLVGSVSAGCTGGITLKFARSGRTNE